MSDIDKLKDMLYDAELNDWYIAVEQLEQQLKEAESVISELIYKTEYGVNQWQEAFSPNEETKAQKVIAGAKKFLYKYKGNKNE